MTIRERIKQIQKDLLSTAKTPDRVRDALIVLSSLYGNVTDEQRAADHEYKLVLLGAMRTETAASRARIAAEVTPQYQRAREAKDTAELVVEMIRSCKAYLRSLDQEMQLAR